MPRTVQYTFEFPYRSVRPAVYYPILTFRLSHGQNVSRSLEIEGFLDTGAEMSLFDGSLMAALGIDLLQAPQRIFVGSSGHSWSARIHDVALRHEELGEFRLKAAFSESPIARNLLGRDFFDRVQVGFREHQLTFFITPLP